MTIRLLDVARWDVAESKYTNDTNGTPEEIWVNLDAAELENFCELHTVNRILDGINVSLNIKDLVSIFIKSLGPLTILHYWQSLIHAEGRKYSFPVMFESYGQYAYTRLLDMIPRERILEYLRETTDATPD